jgi:hypothetical protein
MYLRSTSRKKKDGTAVRYYQLAHNEWDPEAGRARAKILHNFGRADTQQRESLARLCRSIARVCRLEVVDPAQAPMQASNGGLPPDIKLGDTFILGPLLVIEALWKKLSLDKLFIDIGERAGVKAPYERALLAMVANRLCEPESKLGLWERWLKGCYLPSCWELGLSQLYRAMDLLVEHIEEVEETVFFRTANLFNLEVDLIFYDTTNTWFTISYEDQDRDDGQLCLRKWGHSKDGTSRVQVVVALAVTREGLPVRSWVLPGNTTDMTTVKRVKADLRAWKLGRCLFVGDAGMSCAENRAELARACGKYVLAARPDSAEVKQQVLSRAGRFKKLQDNLFVKEVVVGNGEKRRRYFICRNPTEAKRQKLHRKSVLKEIRDEMAKHSNWSSAMKWVAKMRTSKRTGRYLSVTEHGWLYLDKEKVKRAEKLDGKWVLITNDDTLSSSDVAEGYKALSLIERCFRSLKSAQIELRPMFHRVDRRIKAHVKLCVLALLVQRLAELECGQPWPRLYQELKQLQATELRTPKHQFFQRNEPSTKVRTILKTLKVRVPPPVLSIS